ncbi:ornithine cyclodeaminase family protein [Oceanimonas baumannii]|uniref:Ornithine cyclodeaminase n=1 Tax=Oceanimonas baumannii TaxID=129578 RepID=A0A235CLA9_9GAMM|nr:ornithine cyclodeaminase family protein [Oceanimonas baumannii]OYD25154.1 ornithine cyclodeaminase [Oceanimonas baumannii]TDW62560.1 ornithine cyclodeaminase [Oceanimonas baumannii]
MQIISAEQIAHQLPWDALIDKIEHSFRHNDVVSPPRHHHTLPGSKDDATLLLMPAWQNQKYIGVKLINVFPNNSDNELPAISGAYLLSDGQTGLPLACIDGAELTRRRTAAASALAARYLVCDDADTLLVVGTGRLAPMLIEAHSAIRPIRRVRIWGRNHEKARELAKQYQGYQGGCEPFSSVEAVMDLAAACTDADIISCATLSTEPLIKGEWLSPGCHLDLVGAFRPDMRETDAACVEKARVFVDTYAGAADEAGDLHHAINEGQFTMLDICADLYQLTGEQHPGRESAQDITLFKSVGASLEDLAAAICLWEVAAEPSKIER